METNEENETKRVTEATSTPSGSEGSEKILNDGKTIKGVPIEVMRKSVEKSFRSRSGVKLPKEVPNAAGHKLSTEEKQAMSKGVAAAKEKKYVEKKVVSEDIAELDKPLLVRYDSNELMVITKTKKLLAYVTTVTLKSPKHFRQTFVIRMQNYVLDALEAMVLANSLNAKDPKKAAKRKEFQHEAYAKLKLFGYISFISLENKVILQKQYLQMALQLSDCINLLVAWSK